MLPLLHLFDVRQMHLCRLRRDMSKEQELRQRLKSIDSDLNSATGANIQRRIDVVSGAVHMRQGVQTTSGDIELDDASQRQLFVVLREMQEAIENLRDVMKQDQQELNYILRETAPQSNGTMPPTMLLL
jgi:hypothetical protein